MIEWIIVVSFAGAITYGIDSSGQNQQGRFRTLAQCLEHGPAFAELQGKYQNVSEVEWTCQKIPLPLSKTLTVHHRQDLDSPE
jgi:hypothetical protein